MIFSLTLGDFRDNKIGNIINKYLMYIVTLLLFINLYAIVLVVKYDINGAMGFISEAEAGEDLFNSNEEENTYDLVV